MLNRYRLSVPTKSAAATWPAPNSRFGLVLSTVKYLLRTEVHTFAFSVAANAILSFFPFVLLLMTIIRRVFHSTVMYETVLQLLRDFLPAGQEFDRFGSDDPAIEGFFDLAGLEIPNGTSSAQYQLTVEPVDPTWSQLVGPYGPWQVQPSGSAQPIIVTTSLGSDTQQDILMQDSAT